MNLAQRKNILLLSVLLSALIAIVSYTGIFTPAFYARETPNWQIQSLGQDITNLVIIIPALIITAVYTYRQNNIACLLWAGTVAYILYTFIIYSFAVHYNRLFILYCLALGLSFYSLLWFIYIYTKKPFITGIKKAITAKATGIYFLIISTAFYFLWLAENIPAALNNTIPHSLATTGLITNPVQVIDLAIFLPAVFITGLLLLKRKTIAYFLVIIILAFFILMNITIGWLAYLMWQQGLESNPAVTIMMGILTLVSLLFLILNGRNINTIEKI